MVRFKNLEAERARSGMTRREMCSRAGITVQTYKLWQNSVCSPNISLCRRVANLFGLSIDYLFEEDIKNVKTSGS